MRHTESSYNFLITRSEELVKKIDTNQITLAELADELGDHEELGYSSLIKFYDGYFALGTSIFSPRIAVLQWFVDLILNKGGGDSYSLIVSPLMRQMSKNEVLAMDFIGMASIEIKKETNAMERILNIFAPDRVDDDLINLESLKIEIKPQRKRNIKSIVEQVMGDVEDEELKRCVIKAKDEFESSLTEFYVVGKGIISHGVDVRRANGNWLEPLLAKHAAQRDEIVAILGEVNADHIFEQNIPGDVLALSAPNAWLGG